MKPLTLILGIGLGGTILLVVAFFVIVNAMSSDAGPATDCSTFRVAPGAWQAADFDRRQDLVAGMQDCDTLAGRSLADVQALLGPPTERAADGLLYEMPYETDRQFLRVVAPGGRVERLVVDAPR